MKQPFLSYLKVLKKIYYQSKNYITGNHINVITLDISGLSFLYKTVLSNITGAIAHLKLIYWIISLLAQKLKIDMHKVLQNVIGVVNFMYIKRSSNYSCHTILCHEINKKLP